MIGSFGLIKPVSNLQRVYDKKLRILSIYAELISLIENREMNAPLLRHLKAEFGMDGKSTTHILKELSRELDKLDLRNNQLLYVLLEGSMFWQLRQVMRIERWRHKYGKYLLHWLDVLGVITFVLKLCNKWTVSHLSELRLKRNWATSKNFLIVLSPVQMHCSIASYLTYGRGMVR